MKFYDREQELAELNKLLGQAKNRSCMAVLTGRRRAGKTLLSLEFVKGRKHLYLFVSKKSEALLCEEYLQEIRRVFKDVPVVGEIRFFKDIFQLLLQLAGKDPVTVIVDEFQEFYNINPSVYSEVQKLWDLHKNKSRLNLIFIGSVHSLMHKIFQNTKEPLFNRADQVFVIKPFSIKVLADILHDHKVKDAKTLFDCYLLTGGSPKYIDILVENKLFTLDDIMNFVVKDNSPFINEGKNILIEEFGKEYGTYFSILELISVGKTSRSEIESILESNVGGYLDRLEKDYAIIAKYKPINAKPNSRSQKYKIVDNFLNFWFYFIYRNRSAIETGNFNYVKAIIRRDYSAYSGTVLEKFFKDLFAESGGYNRIGSYWEKDHQNEIDLVAINDMQKKLVIAEVKVNKKRIDLEVLKEKAKRLVADYPEYKAEYYGLSLEDVDRYHGCTGTGGLNERIT
jgi:AAA+ ATPase superfamily predicted ATPase